MTTEIDRLIRENHDAPADTLVRALFDHCSNIRDDEDGTILASADEALRLWYDVDTLTLVFDYGREKPLIKGECDAFIHLIHQRSMAQPTMDDISDYSASIPERCPPLGEILERPEAGWSLRYTS